MASKAGTRSQVWATIIYEDSAPPDWVDRISEWHIPCFVSPLHDGDKTAIGEDKKPHRHVMVMFSSMKTQAQAKEVFEDIAGVGAKWIRDKRAYGRYLCHLDDPNKCQYSPDEVMCFGGADYFEIVQSSADVLECLKEMISWCRENNNYFYQDLVEYAMDNRPDWFRVIMTSQRENIWKYILARGYKADFLFRVGSLDKQMRERSGSHIADENKHP